MGLVRMEYIQIKDQAAAHVLYSRGRMLSGSREDNAMQKLSVLTNRTIEQIQNKLLTGRRKRVKSSVSLARLQKLQNRLRAAGLDVYIAFGSVS